MKKILMTVALVSLSSAHATSMTADQKTQILKKCETQAATIAHGVDENSKEHVDHEDVVLSKITRVDGGYEVHTIHKFHWDIEAFDPSNFTVEMSATLGGACQLDKITRN